MTADSQNISNPLYLLLGNGRISTSLKNYFDAKQIQYLTINREHLVPNTFENLIKKLKVTTSLKAILLGISDPSISEIVNLFKNQISIPLVHFSGSIQVEGAFGFHPLYSFTGRPMSIQEFESIPFNVDPHQSQNFRSLFNNFNNPVFEMSHPKGSLYHALCVCMGNLSQTIQNMSFEELQNKFQLPPHALIPYLKSLILNLEYRHQNKNHQFELISGPIARKDIKTIVHHLKEIQKISPLLYSIYLSIAQKELPNDFHS